MIEPEVKSARAEWAHGVDRFVNVNTDKAADPISALGWNHGLVHLPINHVLAPPPGPGDSMPLGSGA